MCPDFTRRHYSAMVLTDILSAEDQEAGQTLPVGGASRHLAAPVHRRRVSELSQVAIFLCVFMRKVRGPA